MWFFNGLRVMGYRFFKMVLVVVFMLLGAVVNTSGFNGMDGTNKQNTKADFRERVAASVRWQMSNYPESRLIDLYKNFFQDKFGPGHMISDTASAGAYLRKELATVSGKSQKEYMETTGWEGDFIRVDLAVLKDGLVDYNVFFNAFIKSMSQTKAPSVQEWKSEWEEIEIVIRQLYPNIPGLNEDSKALEELLSQGNFVVHHSDEYNKKYNPHYRLISKKIYETVLSPALR